ncbi:fungal-specific transcription factor [Ilyonectria destructans]|nr:fungal-specific transcription factor [Ilyonectria destructans]
MSSEKKRRFPYTRVACDKCQRRKIKCSGERPCKGCRESDDMCVYKRTTRFRSARRSSIGANTQSSEEAGEKNNEIVVSQATNPAPGRRSVDLTASALPSMLDNSDYYLRLAEKRLVALSPDQSDAPPQRLRKTMVGAESIQQLIDHRSHGAPGGLLAAFEAKYWIKLLLIYEEEIGLQYPFLDIEKLKQDIRAIHIARSSVGAHSTVPKARKEERLEDVALVIHAIVSTLADPAAIEIANPAIDGIFTGAIGRTQLNGVDRDELCVLILCSMYYFLSDREVTAWRGIGIVMRLLQELSCQSSDDLRVKSLSEQLQSVGEKLYWSAYTLDRRWGFGTGLPFAIQDCDINHHPSFADDSLSSAYLKSMVAYGSVASEVRKCILDASLSLPATSASVRDLLNFRVVRWQKNLPARLQFGGVDDKFDSTRESRGEYKLRLMLYLRANQMRTVIHRKSTVQSEPGSFDPSSINDMVEIAQDTIRILVGLARTTDIYHAQHRTFNHFLETALSSLLLIMCCSGSEQSVLCLQDVVAAMELVRQLSAQSPISRRLGDKLQGIQDVVDNIQSQGQDLPHYVNPSASSEPGPAPTDTQIRSAGPSLPCSTADPQSTEAIPEESMATRQNFDLIDPSLQQVPMQQLPSDNISPQNALYPPTFSSTSDPSQQMVMGMAPLPALDISSAFESLDGDFRALQSTELWEILKEYENFGF